jgi:hypothetical protein
MIWSLEADEPAIKGHQRLHKPTGAWRTNLEFIRSSQIWNVSKWLRALLGLPPRDESNNVLANVLRWLVVPWSYYVFSMSSLSYYLQCTQMRSFLVFYMSSMFLWKRNRATLTGFERKKRLSFNIFKKLLVSNVLVVFLDFFFLLDHLQHRYCPWPLRLLYKYEIGLFRKHHIMARGS